jgi:hypothetical protein
MDIVPLLPTGTHDACKGRLQSLIHSHKSPHLVGIFQEMNKFFFFPNS